MRRLPVFFLLDVSESMVGDNLRQLQEGLDRLVSKLRTDPHALETVYLSTIVFAGKARTLTPLTELAMFYPPRLPAGSGTSLGVALQHLMNEIDRGVTKTTPQRKGDWRPVVYLMTDGKPTDDVSEALQRWRAHYASRVTLVAIGIGQHASLDTLQQLTSNVLQLDVHTEEDYRKFVDWVTQSVVAQSRSVADTGKGAVNLAKLDDSIMKKITDISKAAVVDEDLVVLTGRCQNNRLPYILKYERLPEFVNPGIGMKVGLYNLVGVHALEKDYFELSDERALARTVNTDSLIGSPGCPHCGNPYGFAMCRCGQVMCVRGDGPAICPSCQHEGYFGSADGDGFEVSRSRG